jgi:RES domain-containing protein
LRSHQRKRHSPVIHAAEGGRSRFALLRDIELAALDQGWASRVEITRDLGSEWLKRGSSALLRVPSALVPESANYLLNPLHKDAGLFRIEKSYQYPFDVRLKS